MKYITCVAICLFFLSACQTNQKGTAKNFDLTPEDFSKKIDELPNEQLVDVRTPEEYAEGHLKGAKNLNFNADDFAEAFKKLDKSKPVMVYCRSGGRSQKAADMMRGAGYEVYEMEGGISQWQTKELPVSMEDEQLMREDNEKPEGVISLASFKEKIAGKKPVLVDFSAEWCRPCKLMKPTIDKVTQEMSSEVDLIMVDVDKSQEVAEAYGIEAMPTLMIFKESKPIWEKIGLTEEQELRAAITQNK